MKHEGNEWPFTDKLGAIQKAGETLYVTVVTSYKTNGKPNYEGALHYNGTIASYDNGSLELNGVHIYFDFESDVLCDLLTGTTNSVMTIVEKHLLRFDPNDNAMTN